MKYLIISIALTLFFASCAKEETPIITLSKYVCSCEQLDHVENFVNQNISARDSLAAGTVAQIHMTGVALICHRREMFCYEDSEEPIWEMEFNKLDSCEIYQF